LAALEQQISVILNDSEITLDAILPMLLQFQDELAQFARILPYLLLDTLYGNLVPISRQMPDLLKLK
jgi:hypothetical protein